MLNYGKILQATVYYIHKYEYREASKKLFGKLMIIFLISYPIYLLFELWVKK